MIIAQATSEDHLKLTELTILSKAYWGYSIEQINAWLPDLTISAEYINKNKVYKLILEDKIVAYYSFYQISHRELLLDNLFISPKYIGKGIGRFMMTDFLARVKSLGAAQIILYSDPNSEGFYHHFGFGVIGQKETSIQGRFLPIMRKELD